MSTSSLNAYFDLVRRDGLWTNTGNLQFMFERFFDKVPLADRDVLDVGAGIGLAALYAGACGARRVVGLEPEAAGSHSGMVATFERCRDVLDLPAVTMRPETFQQFDPGDDRFDVIAMYNSINHLDEPACVVLQEDAKAREIYHAQFRRMFDMLRPGGYLIAADCSRYNFFARLGLRNPFVRSIEWPKHQSPRFWAERLAEVGFGERSIAWSSFNTLRRPGQVILGNALAAYFLHSHFRLVMRKPAAEKG